MQQTVGISHFSLILLHNSVSYWLVFFFPCFLWTPRNSQISTWEGGWFSGSLNEILFSEVCRACTLPGLGLGGNFPPRESRNFEAFLACHLHVPFLSSIISRKICLLSSLVSKNCKDIGDSLNLFCSLSVTHLRHVLTYYRPKWDMVSMLLGVRISLWIFLSTSWCSTLAKDWNQCPGVPLPSLCF